MEKVIEFHDKLNPDLWVDEDTINEEVENKLLEASEEFYKFLKIEPQIIDILLVGSSTNYNYTKYSDIDLHLVIDFKSVDSDKKFVKEYFDAKKYVWNNEHDIKMFGMEVEFYVQDKSEKNASTSIYSLLNKDWIKKPVIENPEIDYKKVKNKVNNIIKNIELSKDDLKSLNKIKEKIKIMRQSGLEKNGEFSIENLTFKFLRNKKIIDKLLLYIKNNFDGKFSIQEIYEWNELLINK